MSLIKLKKIRIGMTIMMGLLYLIGMLIGTNPDGEKYTFIEALIVSLLAMGLNFGLFSDSIHNGLANDGIKIDFKLYQILGIFTCIVFCYIITMAIYNHNLL